MNRNLKILLTTTAVAVTCGGMSFASAAEVTQQRLENAIDEPQNWLLPYGTYQGYMFSRLSEINRDTVGGLGVAFMLPLQSAAAGNAELNLMNHGLVDEGILFIDDGKGGIYKIDLTSGDQAKVVWKADAEVSADESNRSRGMGLWGNGVYHNLTDGRVVGVDRDTGEFLWDRQVARTEHPKGAGVNIEGEYFDAAPLAVEGKLLVGQSYGDGLTRGFLAAVDAATGDEIWRTYMVPGPGEPGHETWKDNNEVWRIGGAGLWTTGTYDPKQRITIWGTGNAQPMFDVQYRPGDNLFAGSAVAMDVDDGTIKWYFQYTPNEGWDYDENGVHQIYYLDVDGRQETVIGHWARNGFYYRLDGTDGHFLDASQYVAVADWTAGIDPKTGKPVEYDPAKDVQTYVPETRMLRGDPTETYCPTVVGGVRWQSIGYNPGTFRSYVAGIDGCTSVQVAESRPLANGMLDPQAPGGIRGRAGANGAINHHGLLAAVDVRTNQIVARNESMPYESQSGALVTAGGLVFTAFVDGRISAFDDEALQEVWHFNSGATTKAPPFTFEVNGKQYVAILAGGGRRGPGYAAAWPEAANWVNGPVLLFFSL